MTENPITQARLHREMEKVCVISSQGKFVQGIAIGMRDDGRWIVGCEDNAVRFRFDWQLQRVLEAADAKPLMVEAG